MPTLPKYRSEGTQIQINDYFNVFNRLSIKKLTICFVESNTPKGTNHTDTSNLQILGEEFAFTIQNRQQTVLENDSIMVNFRFYPFNQNPCTTGI
jgi:hypothetical protein